MNVKVGVNKIEFEVKNYGDESTAGVASFNVSPLVLGNIIVNLDVFVLKTGVKSRRKQLMS